MKTRREKLVRGAFWLILALGVFARLWQFGSVPGGLNQDEAFAGYEAWSLLKTGMDTAGYRFPVYLTAWGSGMNALETYLMLPFVAAFGLKVWAIRLPQLLVGVLSLPVTYLLARSVWDEVHGLAAMLLLAVCPWHVLLSRWGLESNLAPGFLLFALYFFLRGLEDSRRLLLSALFYGLSLYAYATIWPIVPLLLLLQIVYCARHGRLRLDRCAVLAVLLLALLALPLLLFLAVNYGLIGEIRTAWFSVPKLLVLRAGEVSFSNIPENLKNLLGILWTQSDGLPWNTAGDYGLLYPLSVPFALLGLIVLLARRLRGLRSFHPETLVLFQLLGGLLLGALVHVNVNRVNILFLPLVLMTAEGVCWFCGLFRGKPLPLVLAAYLCCFAFFARFYFTDYRASVEPSFAYGLGEAIAAAPAEGTLVFSEDVYYPTVLFYTRTPPEEFRATVRYQNYPAAYLRAASFGRCRFGFDAPEADAAYILSAWTDLRPFTEAGYTAAQYGYYYLLTR